MSTNSDTTAAIDSLENLLKAKIKLQDAQSEAEPLLKVIGLLFEPEVLNDDQKNVLRNGLKSLRKLLEAHAAYSEAVQLAEPARVIVNQLLSAQPISSQPTSSQPKGESANGKPVDSPNEAVPDAVTADEAVPDEALADEAAPDEAMPDAPKSTAAPKAPSSAKATSSKKG